MITFKNQILKKIFGFTFSLCLKKREIYGWEIRSLIEKNFNFRSGLITPYRVLYRLEADGFVKSELRERRRVYKITKKGEEELEKAKNFYRQILTQI